MWVGAVPEGPSIKLFVESATSMNELKLTGNCLVGARPLVIFDKGFGEKGEQATLLKELLS